jgi:hypothetical protein
MHAVPLNVEQKITVNLVGYVHTLEFSVHNNALSRLSILIHIDSDLSNRG